MKLIIQFSLVLILYCEIASCQSVVGTYLQELVTTNESRNNFINKLIVNNDSSFTYMVCNDVYPLAVCNGHWTRKDNIVYFLSSLPAKSNCNGLQVLGVKRGFDKSLLKGIAVTIFLVRGDTTRLIGTILSSKGNKQVLENDRPIILNDETIFEIEMEFLSHRIRYVIDQKPELNSYRFYVSLGGDEFPLIERLPFTRLIFEKEQLTDPATKLSFKRN